MSMRSLCFLWQRRSFHPCIVEPGRGFHGSLQTSDRKAQRWWQDGASPGGHSGQEVYGSRRFTRVFPPRFPPRFLPLWWSKRWWLWSCSFAKLCLSAHQRRDSDLSLSILRNERFPRVTSWHNILIYTLWYTTWHNFFFYPIHFIHPHSFTIH